MNYNLNNTKPRAHRYWWKMCLSFVAVAIDASDLVGIIIRSITYMYARAAPRIARSKLCVRLKSKTTVVSLIRVDRAAALLFIVKPLYCQTDGNCFDSFALQTFYSLSPLCLGAEHCVLWCRRFLNRSLCSLNMWKSREDLMQNLYTHNNSSGLYAPRYGITAC